MHNAPPSDGPVVLSRRHGARGAIPLIAALTTAVCVAALGGLASPPGKPAFEPAGGPPAPAAIEQAAAVAPPAADSVPAVMLVEEPPAFQPQRITALGACFEAFSCEEPDIVVSPAALGPDALALWQGAPLDLEPEPAPAQPFASTEPLAPPADEASAPSAESQAAAPVPVVRTVPLPVRRPAAFRQAHAPEAPRRAGRPVPQGPTAAAPAATQDNRSLFESLFGAERSPAPAMSYAALETKPVDPAPRRLLAPAPVPPPAPAPVPTPRAGGGTAVYDISARIVTLPSGERLEAHSGLGAIMDDPRYVHLPARGATPPGTYDLTEREQPFHGVRALRLTPVGGSAAIHGRVGLLAHHYLRGPSGESSGCVSLRDYNRFLQAYLRGEIQRLVVVTGGGLEAPSFLARLFGARS